MHSLDCESEQEQEHTRHPCTNSNCATSGPYQESMFIAGSYMLYSSPPTSMGPMSSLEPLERPTASVPSDNRNTNNNKFSMSSILEHVVPKTAACHVVVSSSPSSTRTSPRPLLPPANTFSRQLKFGVDRILAISDCPVKRACSPMSEMASLSSRSCASCLVSRNCCAISCPFGPHIGPTLGPGGGHHPHHHHPQSHPYASTFPTTIVSPQPLIPFGPYAVYSPLTSEMHHHQQQESKGHQQQGPSARTIMQHQQAHHHHHHHHPPPPHHHHPHHNHHQGSSPGKRKRSWSRAVFSNLQRKGLEKRFQIQKYITKPDRRQLAATLGLTDAQVKVWFQNRRMKWRHSKEAKEAFAQQQDQQKPKTDAATNKCNNSKNEEVTIDESDSKIKKVEDGPVISAISVENSVANK